MIAELLRHPDKLLDRCREPGAQSALARTDLVLIALGGALFGAAVGTFRGGAQIPFAALKVPLATLATLAICGPGFAAFAAAFGRPWTLRETLALTLTAGARSSLVLFALAPAVWLAIDLGAGYHPVRLVAAAAYGLAGLSGLLFLLRGLGPAFLLRGLGPAPGRWATAASFVVLFGIVGSQTAWLLRPYLGDPRDGQIPLFAHGRREGGLAGVLGRSIGFTSEPY
jgi:hypothetical protein